MPKATAKLQTDENDRPDCWILAEKVLEWAEALGLWVLLYGPPGTGKSWAARKIGVTKEGFFPVNLTEDSSSIDLIGRDRVVDSQFRFFDGPAIMAWRKGARLVLEEIEKCSGGDAHSCLLGLLDDPSFAQQVLPTGEIIRPAEGFHAVATGNCEDPEELPAAVGDRFQLKIHIDRPHPRAIAGLPVDLQALARNGISCKDEKRRVSFRSIQAFGKLREVLPETEAAHAVWGHQAHDILGGLKIGKIGA